MSAENTTGRAAPSRQNGVTQDGAARRLRVLAGASAGTLVEFYDFAVYGLMVPTIAGSYFPPGNQVLAVISAFAVYGVAFVIRPLGGVVFGALGDRLGRRRVLSVVITLIGLSTALIGALPTYEQVGILAPLLLVLLRLVQGLSAGGETTSATSFAIEHSGPRRRALWTTIVISMTSLSSIVGAVVVLGVSSSMSHEAFSVWGWRIVFLVALPLSLAGLYIRQRTDESPAFEQARAEDQLSSSPVRESIRNDKRSIFLTFALASMTALAFYCIGGYFPTFLQTAGGLTQTQALVLTSLAQGFVTAGLWVAGAVADRVGRRFMIRLGAVLIVVLSVPAFMAASSGGPAVAFIGMLLLAVGPIVFGGGSFVALLELFPTRTRLSGTALGYNAGYAIFGGTAPLVASLLVEGTGNRAAPGIYLAVVAVLILLVTWRVPETRDISMTDGG